MKLSWWSSDSSWLLLLSWWLMCSSSLSSFLVLVVLVPRRRHRRLVIVVSSSFLVVVVVVVVVVVSSSFLVVVVVIVLVVILVVVLIVVFVVFLVVVYIAAESMLRIKYGATLQSVIALSLSCNPFALSSSYNSRGFACGNCVPPPTFTIIAQDTCIRRQPVLRIAIISLVQYPNTVWPSPRPHPPHLSSHSSPIFAAEKALSTYSYLPSLNQQPLISSI